MAANQITPFQLKITLKRSIFFFKLGYDNLSERNETKIGLCRPNEMTRRLLDTFQHPAA